MIVLDANVILSAILGEYTKSVLDEAAPRGLRFGVPRRQIGEVGSLLTEKFSMPIAVATSLLDDVMRGVEIIPETAITAFENAARERLHQRGQSDWPVLAAALAYGGAIWSDDRDFFGVGVPVWSTKNVKFAQVEK